MANFDGARALVTGGGSGIGAAIARRLARDGAEVWVMGRRREALLDVSDNVIVGDVSVRDDCNRAIAECGPLDILINNAGVGEADWERRSRSTSPGHTGSPSSPPTGCARAAARS